MSFLTQISQFDGIRLLPIPYSKELLQQDYLPSTLRHQDYPNIIAAEASVDTIAIKSALLAYNWPIGNERYRLLDLFVQTLFTRFPEFLGDGHHPKWREVNLTALLPGWRRFRPAERWLQQQSGARPRFARRSAGSSRESQPPVRPTVKNCSGISCAGENAIRPSERTLANEPREVSMRKALVSAALVALLVLIADVRRPAAQFAPFWPQAPQQLPPASAPPADNVEQTRTAPHRSRKAHRKHEVIRPPPNQREVAEKADTSGSAIS